MIIKRNRNKVRKNRHNRIRRSIFGTQSRPRLNVFRSNSNIYAQIIDDNKGITLVSASTLKENTQKENKTQQAEKVGLSVAKAAQEKNIAKVVFDRGGYLYHGRVKAVADGARKGGLKF